LRLLAGLGIGGYASFEAAAQAAWRSQRARLVEPADAQRHLYDELFGLFRELYPATRAVCHELAQAATVAQ